MREVRAVKTASEKRAAVVLLSGGLDSYTTAAIARDLGFELYALTVRYGQTHFQEIRAARAVAAALAVTKHMELEIDLRPIALSALTGTADVPKDRPGDLGDIPATYVPARNTVFLALALAWSESLGTHDIFIGVNAIDYSGYPDCRPEYIRAFEQLARLGTKAGVEGHPFHVHAPLAELSKGEIIRRGLSLGLDYGLTLSCYDPEPDGRPCGHCDACTLRAKGFAEAGVPDPLLVTG
jgi:7-cyano-7-deazaguanine synthase